MAAFSLIELMFAMGLAATLASIALPQALASVDEARGLAAARYVAFELQRTRMEAIKRSAASALRITPSARGYSIAAYVDGNRNGVLSKDIQTGADPAILSVECLSDRFPGVDFGALPGLPPVDPAGSPPGLDPIRLGSSDMASFTPLGTSTSGSLYIRGRHELQLVVRIFGETGRTRILKFDSRASRWVALQEV